MITDGLNPFTVLLFVGAVLGGGALVATYVFARITKREPVGGLALRLLAGGVGVYVILLLLASVTSRSRNNDPETPFIIGHENSLFHGRTTFALPARS